MAAEHSTPAQGTADHTVRGAQEKIASLLSLDEGTQPGSEATPVESEEEETGEEQETEEQEGGSEEEGSESEQEEEEREEQEQELPDDAKVVIDGKEVTLHELKRGFLREQDYTRKTQALAEQRRQFEATAEGELTALRTERQQLSQALGQVQAYMQELMPKEPDWNALYARDPAEYAAQRELWRTWQEQVQGIEGRRRQIAEREQAENLRQLQNTLQAEKGKLMAAIPEWEKPEVAKAEKQKILDWGQKVGFSEDELNTIIDHRALVVARKAMLYDELMGKKQQLRATPATKVKTVAPGSSGTKPGKATDLTRSKQRLAQTGRVRDAAAVFEQLLGD